MESQVVLFEKRGHIAVITLNRPKAFNAVSGALSKQMEECIDKLEKDDDLWIGIICSSNEKVFCAGADLKAISQNENISTQKGGFAGLVKYPRTKPLIAAVDGKALAGGCEIVLACDLVVASKKSEFGVPEVKRSLVAAAGGLFRLPQKLPTQVAMELVLTGDPLPAERMYQLGFVNILAENGKSLEEAIKLAERIEVNAPLAVRESLNTVKASRGIADAEAFKLSEAAMNRLAKTPDFKEGPLAFIEKRKPRWTGKL